MKKSRDSAWKLSAWIMQATAIPPAYKNTLQVQSLLTETWNLSGIFGICVLAIYLWYPTLILILGSLYSLHLSGRQSLLLAITTTLLVNFLVFQ